MNICVSICMTHVYTHSSLSSWSRGLNVYTVKVCNFLHFTLTLALLEMDILRTLLCNAFNRHPYTRVGNNIPQSHIRRKLNGAQYPCFTNSTLTVAVPLLHHHSSLELNINLIKAVSWCTWAPMGKFLNITCTLATAATYHFFYNSVSHFHFSFDIVVILIHKRWTALFCTYENNSNKKQTYLKQ